MSHEYDYTQIDAAIDQIDDKDKDIAARPEVLNRLEAMQIGVDQDNIMEAIFAAQSFVNLALVSLANLSKERQKAAPGRIIDTVVELRGMLKRGTAMVDALLPRLELADEKQPTPKLDA